MKRWIVSAALIVLCICCSARAGVVVTMHDGRVFEGRIIKESNARITIETTVSNIATQLTLRRVHIASIEEIELVADDAPDTVMEATEELPALAPAPADSGLGRPAPINAADITRYLLIPIHGQYGVDVLPDGVSQSLDYAARRGVEHIVFDVDSPGGYIWAAEEIADEMHRRAGEFTYHAVVRNAVSAAIWTVFSCDQIHFLPGATMGAAVAYSRNRTTGNAQVDAKFNSALAARLASRAEEKGHNPVLARAMVLVDSGVYVRQNQDGTYHFTTDRPRGADTSEYETLVNERAVLTLTAPEAVRYGVGRELRTGPEDLGRALGIDEWRLVNNYGAAAMRRTAQAHRAEIERREDVLERIPQLIELINRTIAEAQALDPNNGRYSTRGGNFTPDSRREWQRRTDESIGAWRRVQDGLRRLERLEREAERLNLQRPHDTVTLRSIAYQTEDIINRLAQNRNRTGR
ncbi:MAG: hypothetical protein EA376_04795 [Phycisphaeraceae bacterium]|nr:MAG: hypothetical protein EA376_04795 [Phycisphaeraceae bacterium]